MFHSLYKLSSNIFAKRVPTYLQKRIESGKEDATRITERYGKASTERPAGTLLWIHAASVGESRSVLALIHALLEKHTTWHILVTTGTVSSARIITGELPTNALHQYLPLDVVPWVNNFLDHWRPDAVVWVEQEIWPNMLSEIHARQIPAILANGRMEESSFRRWLWIKSMAKTLLYPFKRIYGQSAYDAQRFAQLSGQEVLVKGNLKFAAEPLPYNPIFLDNLKNEIGERPLWLAASTHMGEDLVISEAHKIILKMRPNAVLVIVPRHPDRGDQIITDLNGSGLSLARRSTKEYITNQTQIYLADTYSELGLFYRLADIVFVGGSLVPVGGHNLVEPAQLNCAILYGPHMHNNLEIKHQFENCRGSIPITTGEELAAHVLGLLNNPNLTAALATAASNLIATEGQVLEHLIKDIEHIIE
jgi:3-deoxy-D-manno-octulosonic-acid transferase